MFGNMDGCVEERDSGLSCLNCLVLGFNIVFMMTGIVMVSIGTTIFGVYYYFNEFLETRYFSPASMLIVTGGLIFLIAVFGFISVIKGSTLMINIYCVLLGFIFLLQLSAGISAVVLKGSTESAVLRNMNFSLNNYPYDSDACRAMDSLQSSLSCCGIYDPYDWKGVFTRNNSYTFHDIILPESCCKEYLKTPGQFMCFRTSLNGCLQPLKILVYQTLRILFGSALTLGIIQLTGITFSHRLARVLVKVKSERLARDIVMQNQRQNMYDAMGINSRHMAYTDKPPSYDELTHTYP